MPDMPMSRRTTSGRKEAAEASAAGPLAASATSCLHTRSIAQRIVRVSWQSSTTRTRIVAPAKQEKGLPHHLSHHLSRTFADKGHGCDVLRSDKRHGLMVP